MPRSNKSTGCVISLVLTSLLLVSGLVVFVALAQLGQPKQWLFNLTGEEALLPQLKGLSDLAAGAMRPRLQTADMAPIAHAGVNPLGVNVFLEQEVDPAKREQVVRMASEAGFHWLRQEFPWEDIEIHGKGDFEDRRNQPARSAWEKYDHIVDLAEKYDLELIVRLSNPPAWSRADGDARGTFAPRRRSRLGRGQRSRILALSEPGGYAGRQCRLDIGGIWPRPRSLERRRQ